MASRIPGAKYFDVDEIADPKSKYPHMLPDTPTFTRFMKMMRIKTDGTPIVCYDQYGFWSAPRVWWMFNIFGKTNRISILNGGLPKWISEGHEVESGEYEIYAPEAGEPDSDYAYQYNPDLVATFE
jgi:thiosulfate/3-mercaptopyruvate sulfurtransferase